MSEKIGFIAGGGKVAQKAVFNAIKAGFEVYVAGFDGITDFKNSDAFFSIFKLGQVGKIIDFFKKNNVKKVVLIGNIPHVNVFKDLKPDIRGALFIMRLRDRTPKGIFEAVEKELISEGIEIEDSTKFLSDCLMPKGILVGKLKNDDLLQIEYGFKIAKNIALMDIGLTVIIKDFCVISVEAVEGTDACIKRAGEILGRKSGFIVVKVARPNQDMKFDLPVIGSGTLDIVWKSGGRIIAAESKKTLIADYQEMISFAKDKGITIYGV